MFTQGILTCHKESFASMILRNEWYIAPSGYSSNTHMFILGRHPLVKVCLFMRHQALHTFRGIFQNNIRSFWLKLSRCPKHNSHKHFEWFSNCFCQCSSIVLNCIKKNKHFYGTLVYHEVKRWTWIIRYSQQTVTVLTHSLPFY